MIEHPQHPEEITADWITFALRRAGVISKNSVKNINKDIIGGGKGFLSSVVKVELQYDMPGESLPNSVVVKIEPENESYKQFGEQTHVFEREIKFYSTIAKNIDIRLPKVYFTVDKPPAFCIVMEDLSSYAPGNQIIGMHHNKVIETVKLIARIQAKFWNNENLNALDWMPETNFIKVDQGYWDSFIDKFSSYLNQRQIEIGEKVVRSVDWLVKEKSRRTKTVVHCDLREDNLMFGKDETENEILIIDWQLAIKSIGAFDVARLVGGSELVLERQGHEFEVLQYWYKELLENGVKNYSWDEAVYDFKLCALFCLCLPIFFHKRSINPGGRVKKLREVIIRGHFASVEEIDALSILP